ncbi:PE domain-containing protein [Mycobacterium sp. AZCC_0083]|uniref:PE domain-containing protein n=1 Tax=Mycobacterium sp. AZCC_0083 TaxID=2735882 RepID=UPI0016208860|nr:PE domain-containing protein [Mycobacterium sp. AZCC_0083]MBB5167583.1 hypothetical protein [Mycobacterium sp. AZCC_0083]
MTRNDGYRIEPLAVADATNQLDELASRIERLMQTEAPNLTVAAPARDEVSQRVASTLNDVQAGFARSTDQGTHEMRAVAATLRAHTNNVAAAEQDFTV